MDQPVYRTIELRDARLRTATWGHGRPTIVMLHDGLGSLTQWRDVPASVAARTGETVFAYERRGHGESTPVPTGPWPTDWLHREALVLGELLQILDAVAPVLVGHSDGGSTALTYAAQPESGARAVLTLAAHSWVEDVCYEAIVDMRANRLRLEAGLAKHHRSPRSLFEAWSGAWVSQEFRSWDIRPSLHTIEVPTLIAQGQRDAYASEAHAHLTAGAIGNNASSLIVPGLGHIMHHDDAEAVVDLIVEFVEGLH